MSRRSPGEIREQKCSLFLIRVLDFSAEADRGLVPCRGVHQDSQSGHESSILEIRRGYEEEETKTIIFQTVLDIYRDRFLYRSIILSHLVQIVHHSVVFASLIDLPSFCSQVFVSKIVQTTKLPTF